MKTNFSKKVDMTAIKIIVIGILVAIMLLPISMIEALIGEREQNQEQVQSEVANKWGGVQQITGPVLVLPYIKTLDKDQNPIVSYAYFLPDVFNVEGDITMEERSRTIFDALVYTSELQMSGKFTSLDYAKLNIEPGQIQWQDAFVLLGIPYLQGIRNKIDFRMNGVQMVVQPGVKNNSIISSGITIDTPLNKDGDSYEFKFNLMVNGSQGFYITPVGKENNIYLRSDWNTVSFNGDFLPVTREIGEQGFDANWNVLDYNRNYIGMWTGSNNLITGSSLGLDFKYPVNKYQMTMRSVKYAIIFIVLTFVVFFLVEVLSKKRIHPIQYLLVSCALVLFYTLLLAISEHIGFGISYLISAMATTILITTYSATIFHSMKQTLMMGNFLVFLYGYLYIVLQQENMALLFGAIGLFIALAAVMFVLRKVDWYKNSKDENLQTDYISKNDNL